MTLQEISCAEFNEMADCNDAYYNQGVIFDEKSDNVVAFEEYTETGDKYYKVVRE